MFLLTILNRLEEKLFVKLFHQNIMSVARSVCQEKISFDYDTVFKIIRAFVYGVANWERFFGGIKLWKI